VSSVLETAVHTFDLPLAADELAEPWRPVPAFRGPTGTVSDMGCHASVLMGGRSPHPPHAHDEEELLIPLHGEVELVVPADASDPAPRLERLRPGSFVYYPARQHHTIRNPGTSPVAYLMFKWRASATFAELPLGTEIATFDPLPPPGTSRALSSQLLLEGPTECLAKLHAHLTTLEPDAGYDPHRDSYDVAIVTLEGTVETLGMRLGPVSVVYYAAGEAHGMRSVGSGPARYLVLEFHPPDGRQLELGRSLGRRIASRLRRARARRP